MTPSPNRSSGEQRVRKHFQHKHAARTVVIELSQEVLRVSRQLVQRIRARQMK